MTHVIKKMPPSQIVVIALTAIAVILLVAGFLTPPMGKIDGSVLQGTGILFGFAALWVAAEAIIERGADVKTSLHAGQTSATIEVKTDEEEHK